MRLRSIGAEWHPLRAWPHRCWRMPTPCTSYLSRLLAEVEALLCPAFYSFLAKRGGTLLSIIQHSDTVSLNGANIVYPDGNNSRIASQSFGSSRLLCELESFVAYDSCAASLERFEVLVVFFKCFVFIEVCEGTFPTEACLVAIFLPSWQLGMILMISHAELRFSRKGFVFQPAIVPKTPVRFVGSPSGPKLLLIFGRSRPLQVSALLIYKLT